MCNITCVIYYKDVRRVGTLAKPALSLIALMNGCKHSRLYVDIVLNTATHSYLTLVRRLDRQTNVIMSVWGSGLLMAML